ncbi:MAG TPA: class II aldolase/adducin family protein [Clostridia bacterium]|nr:class II aldolase/adducin family protein [Clostridia bacterium]
MMCSDFIYQQAIRQTKNDMLAVGKRLAEKGLLIGKGGNYSVRVDEDRILITASGFCKSEISPEQISLVDMQGNLLEGLKPALDIRMHLEVYRSMPEIRAIVHSHPYITTGIAMSNYTFEGFCMPEAMLDIGGIEVTDFSVPTTEQVPAVVHKAIVKNPDVRALVLKGHGALCLSSVDVMDACYKLECLEAVGAAVLITRILGGVYEMTAEEIAGVQKVLHPSKK